MNNSDVTACLTEGICAPMNEVDTYNKLFRDPTSKGGGKK
jgi:hypothetical protein